MAKQEAVPDWLRLQQKIFSRWVQQKVAKRKIVVKDVVTDISDGLLLIALIEELSEKTVTEKYEKNPKMRAQKLDNATIALKFVWANGVELKNKPSAENIVDGDARAVLGLIWAIMLKFMKLGDEDEGEQINFKDALLTWVKNKIGTYPNINIESYKKSFADGLALCALIHKHRPKLINYDSLHKEEAIKNLQTAIDAAEKYINLEKYLAPEDIPKLDENSMVIYVSEYYYGIAEQRKLDIAARRISKLIKFTKENDAKKKEYNEKAQKLTQHIKSVEVILEDRTIDNTMAGAKKRIEDFYSYKTKDKNVIINDQLTLEGIYNSLAMRLNNHKRPEYIPPPGCTLKDLEVTIKHLEECEQERNIALHAELNRQIRLVKSDEEHKLRSQKLNEWNAEKEAYLKKKEEISSVGAALFHLRTLDAFDKERESIIQQNIGALKKLGAHLLHEKYERGSEVTAREQQIDAAVANLANLSKQKRPVLDDDLAREQFKESTRLKNLQHIGKHDKLQNWVAEQEAYLKKKESINSISEAQTALSLLEAYEEEKKAMHESSVKQLKELGKHILGLHYKTQYSEWKFETPQEIHDREKAIDDKWVSLASLSAEKLAVLQADLKREQEKERLRLEFAHHASEFTRFTRDTIENSKLTQFGFTLPEVEAFKAELDKINAGVQAEAAKHKAEYEGVDHKLKELSVTENIYTKETLDTLAATKKTLDSALESRNQAYAAELKKQQENDALCKQFADLVEPLSKWVSDQKSKITGSKDSLEDQLKFVQGRESSVAADGASLSQIKTLDQTIKSKGITQNRHTNLTLTDIEVQWDQWKAFLEKKKGMLIEEIEHQKLRGITQQEMNEIEENFKRFDADKSNNIDRKELKACLYSLGEEKSKSQIEEILQKYGKNGKISYEGFREFMITVYGDTDTKEEIINGFQLINRGGEVATKELSELVMADEDWLYISETAPKKGNGFDYVAWTTDVFSR